MTRPNNRISIRAGLQRKWFDDSMQVLRQNYSSLSDYQRNLFNDLDQALDMIGHDHMTVTTKQMEFLKQTAFEIEKGA